MAKKNGWSDPRSAVAVDEEESAKRKKPSRCVPPTGCLEFLKAKEINTVLEGNGLKL